MAETIKRKRDEQNNNNPEYIFNMAKRYYHGYKCEKNIPEAFRYCKMAADSGHVNAQYWTGWHYEEGRGCEKDMLESFKYFKLAADNNHVNAQHLIGWNYENGDGCEKNIYKAYKYYKLAADNGKNEAQFVIASYYYEGSECCAQNLTEAFKYYKLSADNRYHRAYVALGNCYYFGIGCEQNISNGIKYWKLALDNGHICLQEKFNYLKKFTLPDDVKKSIIEKAIKDEKVCPITLNPITSDTPNIIVTNCQHCFEFEGMFQYFNTFDDNEPKLCPLCRTEL